MDGLLIAIYELGGVIDSIIFFVATGRITDASSSAIDFTLQDDKTKEITSQVNLSQILATEPVGGYRCAACGHRILERFKSKTKLTQRRNNPRV